MDGSESLLGKDSRGNDNEIEFHGVIDSTLSLWLLPVSGIHGECVLVIKLIEKLASCSHLSECCNSCVC